MNDKPYRAGHGSARHLPVVSYRPGRRRSTSPPAASEGAMTPRQDVSAQDDRQPVSSEGTRDVDPGEYSDYYPGDDRNTHPAPRAAPTHTGPR